MVKFIIKNTIQDKQPYNEKGQRHGYWELYHSNGKLAYKGIYINGEDYGLRERYFSNGQLRYKGNFINNKLYGLWEGYYSNGKIDYKEYYAR